MQPLTNTQIEEIRSSAKLKPLITQGQEPTSILDKYKNQSVESPGIGSSIFKGAVVDPVKALLVRPAIRFGQALAAPIVYGSGNQQAIDNYNRITQQPTETPFGITVEGQKQFGQGGAKQIAGEGLEAATDIASLAGVGSATNALKGANTFLKGASIGAKSGALTGGVFGAGQGVAKGLQEDKSAGDIAIQGATQGLIGAATGGIVGGLIGGTTGSLRGLSDRRKAAQDILQQKLQEGRQASDVIQYAKDPNNGKVSIDPLAKKALDEGLDPTDVQLIKDASPEDKTAFKEMYSIAEKASKDKTVTQQPIEVAGKAMVNQAKYIDEARRSAGQELGTIAKGLSQTPVDVTPQISKFETNLTDAGINIGKGGQLDFSASRYANQPGVQKAIQKVYDSVDDFMTPASIIANRQKIFTDLNYAKAGNEIIPGDNVNRIIGELYDTLDEPLKTLSPAYGEAAKKYAQASGVLRDFGALIGKNFDLTDDLTNLRAGEVGQRLLGNASAKPLALLQTLNDTAKALGYTGTEDIRTQFLFSQMLQDPNYNIFAPTQTGSLRGQVARGVTDVVKGYKGGFFSGTANLAEKGLNVARQITPEGKRRAIQSLIGFSQNSANVADDVLKNPQINASQVTSIIKQASNELKNSYPDVAAKLATFNPSNVTDKMSLGEELSNQFGQGIFHTEPGQSLSSGTIISNIINKVLGIK